MKCDVVIVGAGPAGLFAAYELVSKNKNLKIAIIDRGKFADKRVCPITINGGSCINCTPCNILSGYGGAGTFSDGKLNFIPKLGKSDLFKYVSETEAYKLIDDCEEIFNKFGMDANGNYGYYKVGADTLTPFKSGGFSLLAGQIEYIYEMKNVSKGISGTYEIIE